MKEENKKCKTCMWYYAYYIKGYYDFKKQEIGECIIHKKVVTKCETCEKWNSCYSLRKWRKKLSINYLSDIHSKITVVEETLKDLNEFEKIRNE